MATSLARRRHTTHNWLHVRRHARGRPIAVAWRAEADRVPRLVPVGLELAPTYQTSPIKASTHQAVRRTFRFRSRQRGDRASNYCFVIRVGTPINSRSDSVSSNRPSTRRGTGNNTRCRNVRSKCRCSMCLQFTLVLAASCVLHRPMSLVIHR